MNFAATKRLPGFISSPGTRKKFLEPLPLGGGKGLIRLIVTDNWSTGFHAGPRKKTADKGGLLRGEEEQIPRVWIRANDWQRFRSAGHGVPRDAASWVGRRKIYPHTATHTPVHVRHRQPDVSPSSFHFQTTWCPLWEKSSLSGLVPRRRRRRRQSSDREERETDITTSMNIWERSSLLLAWTEIKAWTRG